MRRQSGWTARRPKPRASSEGHCCSGPWALLNGAIASKTKATTAVVGRNEREVKTNAVAKTDRVPPLKFQIDVDHPATVCRAVETSSMHTNFKVLVHHVTVDKDVHPRTGSPGRKMPPRREGKELQGTCFIEACDRERSSLR